MAIYSDYGSLYDVRTGVYTPAEQILKEPPKRTQVYKATHEGELYLPFMDRSFISFSFGGKNIEDFDLIATTSGDRMEYNGYANFDNLVSSYDVLHGQAFWGSYYKNNTLNLTLATDGITQRKLDDFLRWFQAGKVRELILAEHPNRAIMARVNEPPHLSLLPFEEQIEVRLKQQYYNTSTTLYKGTITLALIMDEPHWYSKINIFGKKDSEGIYRDVWTDANGIEHSALEIPDAIKILHEDGIPLSSMIDTTMILGGNIFASVEHKIYSRIVHMISESEYNSMSEELGYYNNGLTYNINQFYAGAVIFDSTRDIGGRIAGTLMSEADGVENLDPIELASQNYINFYYAGTAPSPVILKFSLTPEIADETYVCIPSNQYANNNGKEYNIITIEGIEKKEFKFTTPNILTSYNQVMKIFTTPSIMRDGQDWAHIRELIREGVTHAGVRAWANRVIDYVDQTRGNGEGIINTDYIWQLKEYMKYFLRDSNGNIMPMSFVFNSETGEAVGTVSYRNCISEDGVIPIDYNHVFGEYCADENYILTTKENVGDMVKSKYLIIEERNYPNEVGNILPWEKDKNYTHRLYHDVRNGLQNVYLEYKNMYF